MPVKERSFWSSTSGVVTGIAGTVTGLVALVTVATQLGLVGSSGDGQSAASDRPSTTTTVVGSSPSSLAERGAGTGSGSVARGSRRQTTGTPEFTVDPRSVSFDALGERTATVKVLNSGTAPLDLDTPTVEGSDADAFSVSAPSCTQDSIDPGRSCDVEVTFAPKHNGDSDAELVIEAAGADPQEVALSGKALL